ncbi:MAG: hypothetical protein WCE38_20715 [Burkholderiales bacterium]
MKPLTRCAFAVAPFLILAACASEPLIPYSPDTPPLVLTPAAQAGVKDKRARFREIYCAVLEARGHDLPDYRPCDDALTRVGAEPTGTGKPVDLGPSRRRLIAALVPGVGWGCIANWLEPLGTAKRQVEKYGYDLATIEVDALSGTTRNAKQIRDALMAMPADVGYRKFKPPFSDARRYRRAEKRSIARCLVKIPRSR